MTTHRIRRFGRSVSSLLGLAAVCLASATARAQPTPVKVCRPGPRVSDAALLKGCTDIAGDVSIEHASSKTLAELSSLRRVEGTLVIADNPRLTSLEGLSNLHAVEGLVVRRNPALETVAELDNLEQAPRVEVTENHALGLFSGPNGLTHLDKLVVRNNGLFRLAGFQKLVSAGKVVIAKNPRLIYTSGLSRLVSVKNLSLVENPRLAPIPNFFGSLTTVPDELILRGCPGIRPADLRRDG